MGNITAKEETIYDLIVEYKEGLSTSDKSSFNSTMAKYGCPALGVSQTGIKNKKRLNAKDLEKILARLKKVTVERLWSVLDEVEKLEAYQELNNNQKRQYKYHLNRFIEWAKDKLETKTQPIEEKPILFRRAVEYVEPIPTTRKQAQVLRLAIEDINRPKEEAKQQIERLHKIVEDFVKYKVNGKYCREVTAKMNADQIIVLLGWFYRKGKVKDIEDLTLESIVPKVKLRYNPNDFKDFNEYIIEEAKAKYACKDEAKKLIRIIDNEFFPSLNVAIKPATKVKYYNTLVNLAKYVYRDETDEEYGDDYEDVPIIQLLRVRRRKYCQEIGEYDKELVTWEEVLKVTELARLEATEIRWSKERNGKSYKINRRKTAVAYSYNRYLMLSLLTYLPPDRQRSIRELEFGRTIKYGLFNKSSKRFTPYNKLEKIEDAKWYIHLKPEDYKTGDTYGEWISEIPNINFSDGKKYYDYLRTWLIDGYEIESGRFVGLKEVLKPKDQNIMFIKRSNGERYTDISQIVKEYIYGRLGVPITPHDLRRIYVTYLRENGATESEKEAAALWMKHSKEVADKVYNKQSLDSKQAPVYDLIQRIITTIS